MATAGLVRMAETLGVAFDEERAAGLLAYLDAVLAANQRLNLTAIRDPQRAVVLHALDSLAAGLLPLGPTRILDLGTGNGFPGVALHYLWPSADCLLLDRTHKKITAIDDLLRTAGIPAVTTAHLDAAQAPALRPELRASFDLVAVRAVGLPAKAAALATPLTAPGGHLVLWLDAAAELPATLGPFDLSETRAYDLPPPAARQRLLADYRLAN